jgi:FAD/FMN-containing dehydrogenase
MPINIASTYESWGRFPRTRQEIRPLYSIHAPLPYDPQSPISILPYGQGRSYGDSCLNDGAALIVTERLDRFMSFDRTRGILRCEAGVTLEAILKLSVPHGWFLPVTPGTKFVSVGGAIANDVHGKNHHRSGSFAHFVLRFALQRSDGQQLICSPGENPDWFRSTVGGLGLTGLILWADLQLKRVASPFIRAERVKFGDLDEFFALSEASDRDFEYTVAWVDISSNDHTLGRGIFIRGNHAPESPADVSVLPRSTPVTIPKRMPGWLVNRHVIRAFNLLQWARQSSKMIQEVVHYDPFFYPLDSLAHWNRLYGRRGFLQYQCVIPFADARRGISVILSKVGKSGFRSALSILKTFGHRPSLGGLSFPRHGTTLAMDFANEGAPLLDFLHELDAIVRDCGGCVYPAKDARMSSESFNAFFPNWPAFLKYKDPAFSSSFWRRVLPGGQ